MSGESSVKRCTRCGVTKPRAAFAANRSDLDGLQRRCRGRAPQPDRKRQEATGRSVPQPGAVPVGHKHCQGCGEGCKAVDDRAGRLRRTYGLSEVERDELIASQGGVCCICLSAPPVHVDHCHKTGRVRGVLCFNCNSAIGKLRDKPDAARRAAAYLEGNLWKPTLVAPGVCQLPS
ncbi:endonuclease VII domain-containing protein [Streptomyces sp. NBC_00631]|uniref:endonuclease VII domain-containing protein n=1 Tax=Streptomyces sp. NBC_00631 TaxID=2975793 RepID=UPI0030E1C151